MVSTAQDRREGAGSDWPERLVAEGLEDTRGVAGGRLPRRLLPRPPSRSVALLLQTRRTIRVLRVVLGYFQPDSLRVVEDMTRSAAIQLLNDDTASLMRERGQEQANISGKRVDSSENKNDAEKDADEKTHPTGSNGSDIGLIQLLVDEVCLFHGHALLLQHRATVYRNARAVQMRRRDQRM